MQYNRSGPSSSSAPFKGFRDLTANQIVTLLLPQPTARDILEQFCESSPDQTGDLTGNSISEQDLRTLRDLYHHTSASIPFRQEVFTILSREAWSRREARMRECATSDNVEGRLVPYSEGQREIFRAFLEDMQGPTDYDKTPGEVRTNDQLTTTSESRARSDAIGQIDSMLDLAEALNASKPGKALLPIPSSLEDDFTGIASEHMLTLWDSLSFACLCQGTELEHPARVAHQLKRKELYSTWQAAATATPTAGVASEPRMMWSAFEHEFGPEGTSTNEDHPPSYDEAMRTSYLERTTGRNIQQLFDIPIETEQVPPYSEDPETSGRTFGTSSHPQTHGNPLSSESPSSRQNAGSIPRPRTGLVSSMARCSLGDNDGK